MKIAFFMQNIKQGGVDTFISNLILSWPSPDLITLFCNKSHPGLEGLRIRLAGRALVVPYDFMIAQDISLYMGTAPRIIKLLVRAMFWLFGFPYLVYKICRLFRKFNIDRLMIVNGGYPGGDACLAATIAWWRNGNKYKAWHNFHNLALPHSSQPLRRLKEKLVDFYIARSTAGFVTVSNACMQTIEIRSQLTEVRRTFIHNGISPFVFGSQNSVIQELGLPAESLLILMPAVYEPRKGHAIMIRAMSEIVRNVPHAFLLICGDGTPEEMNVVRHLRDSSGLAEHIFLQSHRLDIGNLISQAEVLVLPAQTQESFGYTAVEAMACGCPVVVTDVGGLPEVVDDGGSGYVVAREDEDALAVRIISLLENEDLRLRMGEIGIHRYHKLFSATRMSLKYFDLLVQGEKSGIEKGGYARGGVSQGNEGI